MAKVNVGRQGFLTKSALPSITRPRPVYSNLLLLGSGTNGQTTFTDSSVNNFTINRFGNTQISTAQFPTGMSSSILFDGNGDYLTTTPSTAWSLGTQNFTIECYFYCPSTPTGVQQLIGSWDGTTTLSFQLAVFTNNRIVTEVTNNGIYQPSFESITANNTFAINTWNHVAYVRSGDVFSIYVNGLLVDSRTYAALNVFSNPSSFKVGGNTNNQWFNGYLSNVRVTIGTALYNGNFTPPSLPLTATPTPIASPNFLLNANGTNGQTNAPFIDSSANNYTITPVSNGTPSTTVPLGSWSPYNNYNGAKGAVWFNNLITTTNPQNKLTMTRQTSIIPVANQDFTFEHWIYPTATPGAPSGSMLMGYWRDGVASDWFTGLSSSLTPNLFIGPVGNSVATGTAPLNTWTHIAWIRQGTSAGNMRCYINGVLAGTFSYNGTLSGGSSLTFTVGQDEGSTIRATTFQGYMTDMRVVVGTAVYTANFTPPTQPLTAVTNTQLLLNCIPASRVYDVANGNPLSVRSNTSLNTSVVKFGSASLGMTGTSSGASMINSVSTSQYRDQMDLSTINFTIESWVYLTQYHPSTRSCIIGSNTFNTTNNWGLHVSTSGNLQWISGATTVTSSTTITLNTWVYVTVQRAGSAIFLYINGSLVGSGTLAANPGTNSVNVSIGCDSAGATTLYGYLDDLCFTKGVKYNANGFTPPTSEMTTAQVNLLNLSASTTYGVYQNY